MNNMLNDEEGGLINVIPDDRVLTSKSDIEFPSKIEKVKNLLKFDNNKYIIKNELFLIGSYNLRIQPYYSDIDTHSIVVINLPKKEATELAKKMFQNLVHKISNTEGVFLTDVKAGIYKDGEPVHWTEEEIMDGKRNGRIKDFNGHKGEKKLIDAFTEKINKKKNILLKLDCVLSYYGRYIEASCIYKIYYVNSLGEEKGLTVKDFNSIDEKKNEIIQELILDIKKQREKRKFFKVIKRIFALSRYYRDLNTAEKIYPLLISNVSKLSTILSDIKTIELLIVLNKDINKNIVQVEFNSIIDKLSNILDIQFDVEGVINSLNLIYKNIKNNNKEKTLMEIKKLSDYLYEIINKEVIEYLYSIGFKSFYDFGKKYII